MGPTLRVRLMVAAVLCALFGLAGCGESPTPAGILMGKIHGCINVVTSGGSKQDDDTVGEGQCGLPAQSTGTARRSVCGSGPRETWPTSIVSSSRTRWRTTATSAAVGHHRRSPT